MLTVINRAVKTNGGLAMSIFGWIMIALAIRHPGVELDIGGLTRFFAGFALLLGGFLMMIWSER